MLREKKMSKLTEGRSHKMETLSIIEELNMHVIVK